ncbi:MAG TPA: bifunctional ADP-dependent NAD(P)H-hydrate dehydratase/NAD(P)H-hydrate epimerase, partial [Sorangium sp.]|nr:bifunctional ADP-dependent NAD(P)H-hydrate dehydratase/NAD(P)H-hydrate epimerase [Sorangium sp.]
MIPVLSRAQMRAFDKHAINQCHVPGVVLMENAGRGAADVISAIIGARTAGLPGHAARPAPHPGVPLQAPARTLWPAT